MKNAYGDANANRFFQTMHFDDKMLILKDSAYHTQYTVIFTWSLSVSYKVKAK